eukprot:4525565-Prymnesium_polylepis.1
MEGHESARGSAWGLEGRRAHLVACLDLLLLPLREGGHFRVRRTEIGVRDEGQLLGALGRVGLGCGVVEDLERRER